MARGRRYYAFEKRSAESNGTHFKYGDFHSREAALAYEQRKRDVILMTLGYDYRLRVFYDAVPFVPSHYGLQRRSHLVIDDISEHMNHSLAQPVRSRRHLKELQKIHQLTDYVQSPEMKDRTDRHLGRLKAKHGR